MTQLVAIDYDSGKALFQASDDLAVIVDINKRDVDSSGPVETALTAAAWLKVAADLEYPAVWRELADAAVTKLEVEEKETPPVERKFRIPHAVKAEVELGMGWVKGFERGGTPVATATAKMLSEETYLPLSKVQRIARYFSRRPESITQNAGWSAGSMGFPADDRIKYSLWGGQAAREWILKIDKKHPLLAAAPAAGPPSPAAVKNDPAIIAEAEKAPDTDGDEDVDPDEPHEFVPDPETPDQCLVCGLFQDDELHEGLVAGAFEQNPDAEYFAKGESPDSTYATELYMLLSDDTWKMYDGTGWVDMNPPAEDAIIIMLDPQSAQTLADFIETRDPESQEQGIELSLLNPMEAALFSAAEAEIDWGLVDAVFDIYDSQERSVNAKQQVRGPGGKFGDMPDDPEAKKTTDQQTKARLPQPMPLVENVAARIDAYLAEVAQQRGGEAPAATPAGGDAPAEASLTAEYINSLIDQYGDTALGQAELASQEEDLEAEFNWVEDAGGLPKYIKRIEKHLRAKGMTESHAIATAVNAVKKMCATGDINFPGKQDVNVGSRAEACKAVAEWEAKKAKARSNSTMSTELAEAAPGAVTDVRPLYLAIVDAVDTEAVLDLVSLVPPKAGTQADVTAWRREAGKWVQAPDILADLRGTSPPPVVELTDDGILTEVISQVDAATSTAEEEQPNDAPTSPAPVKPDANPDQHPIPAQAAARGYALPDGSFAVFTVGDLRTAVNEFDTAKNPDLVRAHIIKRARALNRLDLLPQDWDKNERESGYAMWGPHGEILPLAFAEGGADRNRGNAEKLRHYWVRGEGAAKIQWNTPGDWYRCVSHLSKYLGVRAKGYCTLRHREATGHWPGDKENH